MNNLKSQTEKSVVRKFKDTEIYMNRMLGDVNTTSFLIQNYDEIDKYLMGSFNNNLEQVLAKRDFIQAINHACSPYSYLDTILFFRFNGTMVGYSPTWYFFYEKMEHPFILTEKYKQALCSNHIQWIGSLKRSDFTLYSSQPNSTDEHMVCGIRSFTYTSTQNDKNETFVVVLAIDEKQLRQCLYFLSDDKNTVCLLDSDGTILSNSNNTDIGTVPEYYSSLSSDKYSSINFKAEHGEKCQIIFYRMDVTDWILVKIVPVTLYKYNTKLLKITTFVVGLTANILMVILYTIWVRKFCKPLNLIAESLKRVKDGDMSVQIKTNKNSPKEINMIQQQFNQMLKSINNLLQQKEIDERDKLLLEIRNLQAQISPHFIYNTITNIRWMATMTGANKVADMLITFIAIIRPVFSTWKLEWSIKEELKFIDNYIKLMRIRFGNTVKVQINSKKEIEDLTIPRFTLQPLIENCCEHGVKDGQILNIIINILQKGSDLIITVKDDGAGINQDVLTDIKKVLSDYSYSLESKSIGLVNINRRLKLHYGEKYGLSIDSVLGSGAYVEIRIAKSLNMNIH